MGVDSRLLEHCMRMRWTEAGERGSHLNYLRRFTACTAVISTIGKSGQRTERVIKSSKGGPNQPQLHRPGPPPFTTARMLKATIVKNSGSGWRDKINSMETESDIVCKLFPFWVKARLVKWVSKTFPFRVCYHSKPHRIVYSSYF